MDAEKEDKVDGGSSSAVVRRFLLFKRQEGKFCEELC